MNSIILLFVDTTTKSMDSDVKRPALKLAKESNESTYKLTHEGPTVLDNYYTDYLVS
jgi:hypothetical protein